MRFLFPTFLFALLAIAIPIVIHFFNFRRYKTVYFSNVAFLKEIKKESKKKSRIKQLLLLLARILTIVFLVFAFSQPYIPVNRDTQKKAGQIVGIYIDNSFSMNALSEQGQLLEVARNKAVEICMAYPAGTKFRLFTNDLKPKHQHLFNKEQFIQQVTEIKTSPIVIPLSLIVNRFAIQDQEEDADKILYFLSDFQTIITDTDNFSEDNIFTHYIPLESNQIANLYIDSCWVEVPAHRLNQEEEVFVRIINSSDQDYQNLPLKLYLNDSIKSITNFSVSARKQITASLKYTNNSSGSQLGKIEISDYPFTHDNNWYISYFVEPNLKALAIYSDNTDSGEGRAYISALLTNDDYIMLDEMNVNTLQISKLKNYNTIFLLNLEKLSSGFLNELHEVVENGTSVVLFPGSQNNFIANNAFLTKFGASQIKGIDTTTQKISGIDFENNFYKDVFRKQEENPLLPEIKDHYIFEENITSSESILLWFQNNDKALSVLNYNLGKLWVFAFPLEKKNDAFIRDVLFVPTMYNIVLNSLPGQDISYTVGENTFVNLAGNNELSLNSSVEIEKRKNGEKFIPAKSISNQGIRLDFSDQIFEDGHYLITKNNEIISSMAFNYNRSESNLSYYNNTELENKIDESGIKNALVIQDINSNFSEIFDEIHNGKQLWKWCILLALFFIIVEVLIARFWK